MLHLKSFAYMAFNGVVVMCLLGKLWLCDFKWSCVYVTFSGGVVM
jgi:hypothetical protein